MKPVKVSVIIPVYNTELYVRQTIQSILGQTLHDIEIITVDDGSTDNSLSILSELAEQDHRIKIFAHKNQGVSVARNIGLEQRKNNSVKIHPLHTVNENNWLRSDLSKHRENLFTLWIVTIFCKKIR